jgi:hypothetical protein
MRVTTAAAMAIALATSARANQVTVHVQGLSVVPAPVLSRAQMLANRIFADVGVKIDWRRGEPSRAQSEQQRVIVVEMAAETLRERKPDALAFALAYEGVHITVFYDRVRQMTAPVLTPTLLAHVLVHEITHVLEGSDQHSQSGVMKARWTPNDYAQMARKPLSFTDQDVQLIRLGLAKRGGAGTLMPAIPAR